MRFIQIKHFIVAFLFVTLTATAVEYRTLKAGETLTTEPTSKIEITATGLTLLTPSGNNGHLEIKMPDDATLLILDLRPFYSYGNLIVSDPKRGSVITGMESIKVIGTWVTVKITPAETTSPTQPSNVAVIPNDANGQYQVILESSVDMVTWNPVNPGNFGGNTPSRFFRTRIVKLP